MAANGALLATQVDAGGLALSAYAVADADGATVVVLVNKDRGKNADVTVDLGAEYTRATLTGASLDSPTGELLQGAAILMDGSGNPPAPTPAPVSGHTVSLNVGASSAVLLRAE